MSYINVDEIFEYVDLVLGTITPVPLSGHDYDEALGLAWSVASGGFLMTDLNHGFHDVTSQGVVTLLGSVAPRRIKGLAFTREEPTATPQRSWGRIKDMYR